MSVKKNANLIYADGFIPSGMSAGFRFVRRGVMILLAVMSMGSLNGEAQLNAAESNPQKMGWMQGFPPAQDKTVSANDGSFFVFPALRYSVNHIREFYPTKPVPAAKEKYTVLKSKIDSSLDDVSFVPWGSETPMTWKESLDKNYVDGVIVLHKGKIVYEAYPAGLAPDGIHAAMSVSKSFTGMIASILIAEGTLDSQKLVTDYIPELKGSGFDGATVADVLDMTTAVQYSENYDNPNAEVWKFTAAGNVFRPANYSGPQNYYEYLKTVKKIPGQEHGDVFGYRTINTELAGWIISRVTGKDLAELVSEKIWIPMGAKYDGYYQLGTSGIAFAGGGFNLNLRDMAVFGELVRNNGKLNGKQIIPAAAVSDISKGASQNAFAKSGEYPLLKNWSYHNMWWVTHNSHGAFMARGVHGQAIYIDPAAEMVIVRFSSNPNASNTYNDPYSLPAYEAVAEYLMKK